MSTPSTVKDGPEIVFRDRQVNGILLVAIEDTGDLACLAQLVNVLLARFFPHAGFQLD